MSNENSDFKKTVKEWLKSSKKDRQWLAEQCYVGKRAVDKWLSTAREIPIAKVALIKKLMEESNPVISDFAHPPGLPDTEQKNKLFVTLDPETQTLLETQAHLDGMDLTAYCSLILEWAVHHEGAFLRDVVAMFEQKWKDNEKDGRK